MKTYTHEQLSEILDKHRKWLYNEDGGELANLSDADLSYANLSDADLSYANLSYADLSGADLSDADLSYANLSYADLSGADLSGVNTKCVIGQTFLSIDNIGSRNSKTIYHVDKDTIFCGCWKGTLDEFEERVKKVHGDNKYGRQYAVAIDTFRRLKDIHKI